MALDPYGNQVSEDITWVSDGLGTIYVLSKEGYYLHDGEEVDKIYQYKSPSAPPPTHSLDDLPEKWVKLLKTNFKQESYPRYMNGCWLNGENKHTQRVREIVKIQEDYEKGFAERDGEKVEGLRGYFSIEPLSKKEGTTMDDLNRLCLKIDEYCEIITKRKQSNPSESLQAVWEIACLLGVLGAEDVVSLKR